VVEASTLRGRWWKGNDSYRASPDIIPEEPIAMKKFLLVDDHEVVRDGIKRILGEQPETVRFGEQALLPRQAAY
jgi:hypothetical protein